MRQHCNNPCSGAVCGKSRHECCSGHILRTSYYKRLSVVPFVASSRSYRHRSFKIILIRKIKCTFNFIACMPIRLKIIRQESYLFNKKPACIFFSRIEHLPKLSVAECNSHIRMYCCTHYLSVRTVYTRWNVNAYNLAD